MKLTPDQARQLWETGGFALLQGLPEGSETGIDGTFHTIKSFAGHKFVPPGLHMVVWCASPSEKGQKEDEERVDREIISPGAAAAEPSKAAVTAFASAFPLRVAYIYHWAPRERVGIAYDAPTEYAWLAKVDEASLPILDPKLAAYPFYALDKWKALTTGITPEVLKRVLRDVTFVDSLTPDESDDELGDLRKAAEAVERRDAERDGATDQDKRPSAPTSQAKLRFPAFDLKRSWDQGATGQDLSRWSQDKSMLLARVCREVGGPNALLGEMQLAFILVTQVWNYASLSVYKRILSLFCRSPAAMAGTESLDFGGSVQGTYINLLVTLAAQLRSLPPTAFDTELPDLDTFYLAELETLRKALGAALAERGWWSLASRVAAAWTDVMKAGKDRDWDILPMPMGDEDEDDEDGEYAPVVVET